MNIIADFGINSRWWIGVVADPPNWYALDDWLSKGCDIRTEHWLDCDDECDQSFKW